MNTSAPLYTIGYFFTVDGVDNKEVFLSFLQESLRTLDPNAPDTVQPDRVDENTVGFVESVHSKQLKDLHSQIQQVFATSFTVFRHFRDTRGGGKGQLGLTLHIQDQQQRMASVVAQSQTESPTVIAFAYQTNVTKDTELSSESVTPVSSGREAVDAVLAYFGQLQNATGATLH